MKKRKKRKHQFIEIYFDGPVNKKRVRRCIKILKKAAIEGKKVKLFINSSGDDITQAFVLYDFIKKERVNLETIVQGEASSAAVIILLAADKRSITEHSMIMIHRPSFSLEANNINNEEMAGYCAEFLMTERMFLKLIVQRTGKSRKKVKKDIFAARRFDAEESLAYGFVEKIL